MRMSDSTLKVIGANEYGQLGDGTLSNQIQMLQVATDISSLSAGTEHSLYLSSTANLMAMGRNQFGQLGDGTTTDRNSSVEIDSNVSAVVAGTEHSLYIKTNATYGPWVETNMASWDGT